MSDHSADCVAPSKRWYWDSEGDPRHVKDGAEVMFFATLEGEEAAICLGCCECGLGWSEVPADA